MEKIIAISGSLRNKSFNTAILRAAQKIPLNKEIELVSIKDIPLYNGDIEAEEGIPGVVENVKAKLASAKGLLISTPEYNHSIPGVLKNAIDWLSRPPQDVSRVFSHKKVGIIGVSTGRLGTAFSQKSWLSVFSRLKVNCYFGHTLMVPEAHTIFNEAGELVDENTKELLKEYLVGFSQFLG